MDYTSLQQNLTDNLTNGVTSGVQDQLGKLMAWVVIPSVILTVIILVAYIVHLVHRHKVDKAIFEIRDTLREMKRAGLSSDTPRPSQTVVPPRNEPAPSPREEQN